MVRNFHKVLIQHWDLFTNSPGLYGGYLVTKCVYKPDQKENIKYLKNEIDEMKISFNTNFYSEEFINKA